MNRISCTLLILVWLVLFTAPAAILWWAMGPGWEMVSERTGWSAWVSVPVTIAAALVVAGAWIVVVWPKLFGYRRSSEGGGGKQSRTSPAAPRTNPMAAWRSTPAASNAASSPDASTSDGDASASASDASAPGASSAAAVPDDEVRRVHAEALALAESGDHAAACRRAASLRGANPDRISNPHLGCYWGALEESADSARDEARDASNFVYVLCIAEATWEQHFATASGEARSAQVTIDRLRSKMR